MSTEQPRPLQGYKESQETKKEIPVDAKKFQQELSKVQESDESQQQGKRNLKKSEEEIEDDNDKNQQQIAPSGDLFSLFMSDSDSNSLMSPQTPQNIRSTQAPSSSSSFNIEDSSSNSMTSQQEPPAPAPTPDIATGNTFTPPPSSVQQSPISSSMGSNDNSSNQGQSSLPSSPQGQTIEEDNFLSYPTSEPQQSNSTTETTPQTQDTSQPSPTRVQKKETKDTSLLADKKPSSVHLLKKKKETMPEIKLERQTKAETPLSEKKPSNEAPKKTEEKKPLPKKSEDSSAKPAVIEEKPKVSQEAKETYLQKENVPGQIADTKTPLTTPLVDKKKIDEKGKEAPLVSAVGGPENKTETSHDHKDKKDEKEEEPSAPISQTIPINPFVAPTEAPAPAYATLHPQVYELFERMVGLLTMEQHNGVTTTTVTINMKDSVFDGAQIVLDHYSTAPNSFNLTIAGSPKAQELLNANIDNLAASFQASKLSFDVNIRKPVLLEEYQAFKRKEKVGEESHEEQAGG